MSTLNAKAPFKILTLAAGLLTFLPLTTFAHNPDAAKNGEGGVFQQYSWLEIVNPLLLFSLMVAYFIYLKTMRILSKKGLGKLTLKKKISFLLGLLTIYIALAGPVAILSNNLIFSAHMLQQSLMYIIMPPLILLAMPKAFYQSFDKILSKPKFLRIFKSPLVNLFLFNLLWSFYHLPDVYEYFLEQVLLLEIIHIVINTAAFLMWIQVLAPDDQVNEMSSIKKIGYMFANGMLITPACALIIFAGEPIYPSLSQGPQIFSWLPPRDDQQLGGILMKVVQELSYGSIIAYVFFKWAKTERAKDAQIDEVPDQPANG